MLDFCGKTISKCFDMYMSLGLWEKIGLAVLIFVGLFIILRIVYAIIVSFD